MTVEADGFDHPATWDPDTMPSTGTLAAAGVSFAAARSAETGWQHRVVLVHGPSGVRADATHEDKGSATLSAWQVLRDNLIEHERMIEQ